MGAEDPAAALVAGLDAIEIHKGPEKITCLWWREQPQEVREAVTRNYRRVGHTAVTAKLRDAGQRVTAPDIKLHAEGACSRCQTSATS